jgi:hypothetical protein
MKSLNKLKTATEFPISDFSLVSKEGLKNLLFEFGKLKKIGWKTNCFKKL